MKGGTAREKRETARAVLRLGKDFFVVSMYDAWTGDGGKVEEVGVRDHGAC